MLAESVFQRPDQPRARLISSIVSQLRRYVSHAQHIGESFAAHNALGHADLHALLVVMEAELAGQPVTPGDLRAELNFSSGSVTGVVDRLEAAGHVYRDRDTADRRKIFLRYAEPGAAVARDFFAPLARRTEQVMRNFSDQELELVQRFLSSMVETTREHRDELRAGAPTPPRNRSRRPHRPDPAGGPGATPAGVE
ncbi:MarR family transcriptional regulator [Micromonospora sp. WMMD1102]|uniref:MarR family winged helix-turn-helix transcriptional regulator n=1 Tax=Micromonospora sp. WMMD1102 TaxID=3016105 RepID=UPI0024153A3D|nr:MarR family transcriptional regulator [Micromonospora sp. WMMD1102]MDG4785152.1 MarR family transcriptional regulator [Micromonospora sp. WMMD1102]